jgi:N-acetylglucosaminyl-diphospho-decaprenol L-rhamnosyltransferase
MPDRPFVAVSVISHSQGKLVKCLLDDLQQYCHDSIEVILTINTPETLDFEERNYKYPLRIVFNESEKGFGANHNSAYSLKTASLFCIINPDVRLWYNPFRLLSEYLSDSTVGMVAPLVLDAGGAVHESARKFPSVRAILLKFLGMRKPDYHSGTKPICVDWTAGMFMLFTDKAYETVNGFDVDYYLYYEDVDICWRLWRNGYKVLFCPSVTIIHDARFRSHYNLRHFRWHICSLARFLIVRKLRTKKSSKNKLP